MTAASPPLWGEPPAGGDALWLETGDGVRLRAARWHALAPHRGAVLMATGRAEYLEKTFGWAQAFRQRGFAVVAFDWRGQGLSDRLLPDRLPHAGRRGWIGSFAAYQRDLDAVRPLLDEAAAGAPRVVLGHSMGGLALLRLLRREPEAAEAAILSAPMLGLALGRWANVAGRAVSRAAKLAGYGARWAVSCDARTGAERGFDQNGLTSDRAVWQAQAAMLEAHPELAIGGATWGWLDAAFREMRAMARGRAGWLATPTLVLQAGDDPVVSNAAIDALAEREPMAEVAVLRGALHEPMSEGPAVQAAAWRAIDGFLDRAVPQAAEARISSA